MLLDWDKGLELGHRMPSNLTNLETPIPIRMIHLPILVMAPIHQNDINLPIMKRTRGPVDLTHSLLELSMKLGIIYSKEMFLLDPLDLLI